MRKVASEIFSRVRPDKRQCLETAVLLAGGLLLYALLQQKYALGWISLCVLLTALLFPVIYYPLAKLWFRLGMLLSWFSSRLLLSLVFFLVITPVGLIRRLMKKDNLKLGEFGQSRKSVMIQRKYLFKADDLIHPF